LFYSIRQFHPPQPKCTGKCIAAHFRTAFQPSTEYWNAALGNVVNRRKDELHRLNPQLGKIYIRTDTE
jgi:hypothetical protein